MGAFLLVAAAAVFVAVQWDQLGERVKLGILAALTGGFLLAGRRFRTALPATAGVLYHLGAFLIPANVAAVALHLHFDAPQFLLLEGVTAVRPGRRSTGSSSRVLEVACGAAVIAPPQARASRAGPPRCSWRRRRPGHRRPPVWGSRPVGARRGSGTGARPRGGRAAARRA
jgi:hypothetical protein